MARIRFSPLVVGASGKAGDAVFASWKGRSYVRKLVTPANPQTAAQTAVREALARLPSLWRSLPLMVRTQQNTYAVGYRMSGWNWYVGANRANEENYQALLITPPNPIIGPVQAFALADQGGGVCRCTWTAWTTGTAWASYIVARRIEEDEVHLVISVPAGSEVMMTTGTTDITLSASKEWSVALAPVRVADLVFGEAVQDTVDMGA